MPVADPATVFLTGPFMFSRLVRPSFQQPKAKPINAPRADPLMDLPSDRPPKESP